MAIGKNIDAKRVFGEFRTYTPTTRLTVAPNGLDGIQPKSDTYTNADPLVDSVIQVGSEFQAVPVFNIHAVAAVGTSCFISKADFIKVAVETDYAIIIANLFKTLKARS